ncbi:MAG TPA: hypothetical protein VJC21_02590 [Candidatus Nanoarchaeia archaeon]|nr:hypothetical protein [Candidatus Nanoarchaeia archaeon]
MQETINIQKIGQDVLHQLEDFNKKMWDAVSFRMIHAMIAEELVLKDSFQKTQEYRKQRFEKALQQARGDKQKAYQLLASESFN